jgi:hypothetical protein
MTLFFEAPTVRSGNNILVCRGSGKPSLLVGV